MFPRLFLKSSVSYCCAKVALSLMAPRNTFCVRSASRCFSACQCNYHGRMATTTFTDGCGVLGCRDGTAAKGLGNHKKEQRGRHYFLGSVENFSRCRETVRASGCFGVQSSGGKATRQNVGCGEENSRPISALPERTGPRKTT